MHESLLPEPMLTRDNKHPVSCFLSKLVFSIESRAALARIIHEASTAASDPGMSTALRSLGLLDVLSSMAAAPSVARLVSMPVCAASLRTFMNNGGKERRRSQGGRLFHPNWVESTAAP